jgi:type III pantothenate kinase
VILLLDAGNTRIKWGIRQARMWLARGVCGSTEVAALATELMEYPLEQALLCCVANAETRQSLEILLTPRVKQLDWLIPTVAAHGVRSAYQPPESLGCRCAARPGRLRRDQRGYGVDR